jgi:RNA polymerase sigma factor (sigma-70 family)
MDPSAPVPIERLLEHRAWVTALARALVADPNRADDVAQDAWLAALRRPPRHGDALRAWLARLVRHRASNARRDDARRVARERSAGRRPSSVDPSDAVARVEAHERVVREVLALAEPYRTTVVLRFYEGLSGPQIASRMDVPLETVRTRMKRAVARLRERLGDSDRERTNAVAPLLVTVGGLAMQTSTKVGLVTAAALLLAAGVEGWSWARRSPAAAASSPASTSAAAPSARSSAPSTVAAAPRAEAAAVFGEVWRRAPERPAAGVSVRLTSDGAADVVVVADARGRFRFEELPPGTRGVVRVAADDHAAEPVAVRPLLPGESRFVGVMWLAPAASLEVVVTTLAGTLVRGARVTAHERPNFAVQHPDRALGTVWFDQDAFSGTWRDARDPAAAATTDADGRATLAGLVPGAWQLVAAKEGFARATSIVTLGDGPRTTVRLVLSPGLDLAGRVEDRDGRPVADLVLCAHAGEMLQPNVVEMTPRATTDADGRFALTGLDEGRTVLWAARAGAAPLPMAEFRVPTSGPVRVVVGGARLVGTVRDAGSCQPIAGARVRAYVGTGRPAAWTDAVTDAAGAYEMPLFAARAIVSDFRVEGWSLVDGPRWDVHSAITADGDVDTRIDVAVRRAAGVAGRVTHAGAPVRGALVSAFGPAKSGLRVATASTDGDGRYVIAGVSGPVVVKVDAPPFVQPGYPYDDMTQFVLRGTRPPRWCVDVPPDGATLDVDLVDGADLAGRVVDPGDAPVAGAEVIAGAATAMSAADGTFTLHGVDVAATSTVWARKSGFIEPAGAASTSPVVIRLSPCPVVRGTVRATDGALVDGWVEWARKPEMELTSART